jgi:hypothetical protein
VDRAGEAASETDDEAGGTGGGTVGGTAGTAVVEGVVTGAEEDEVAGREAIAAMDDTECRGGNFPHSISLMVGGGITGFSSEI